jgi:hypothetical protein
MKECLREAYDENKSKNKCKIFVTIVYNGRTNKPIKQTK